jgi:peptidase E
VLVLVAAGSAGRLTLLSVPALRQIFAFSGVLRPEPGQKSSFDLIEYAIGLADVTRRKRVCYLPTAVGDGQPFVDHMTGVFEGRPDIEFSALKLFTQPSVPDVRAHLLSRDVLLVEGGSVVNLIAIWRAHGLAEVMRECWDAGVVLAGWSAGSLCWHLGGPTDSYSDALDPFTDGLGLLPYSNGVHDDFDGQPRREVFRRLVGEQLLPAGYASEDGVGLHYVGTDLHEAVSIVPGKQAWWVEPAANGGFRQQAIAARGI